MCLCFSENLGLSTVRLLHVFATRRKRCVIGFFAFERQPEDIDGRRCVVDELAARFRCACGLGGRTLALNEVVVVDVRFKGPATVDDNGAEEGNFLPTAGSWPGKRHVMMVLIFMGYFNVYVMY